MNLVAEWQTWTSMHGSPGHILFKGEGAGIASIAEAAPTIAPRWLQIFPASWKALAW
jgi:hypothetical protein